MTTAHVHVVRSLCAEFVGTRGRTPLWTILVPMMTLLPAAITFVIAYVAERFARIPGQVSVAQVSTSNAAYWVISITVAMLAVAAAYSVASERNCGAASYLRLALPRRWTALAGKWLFYGVLGAVTAATMIAVVLVGLPWLSESVYGEVSVTDAVARRMLWTVPMFAFFAAAFGIGVGALTRAPAPAVATVLFWVYFAENAVGYLPKGPSLQRFAPFLNGVYATGQDIALAPPWGQSVALAYTCATFTAVFGAGVVWSALTRAAA